MGCFLAADLTGCLAGQKHRMETGFAGADRTEGCPMQACSYYLTQTLKRESSLTEVDLTKNSNQEQNGVLIINVPNAPKGLFC